MVKREALLVMRLITEVLVEQLHIPSRQIVNDVAFSKYTGTKRPDLLISESEYDRKKKNDEQYIQNLLAYAEVKDNCSVGDSDWEDAKSHGFKKAPNLKLPYFMVTNGEICIFYNVATGKEIQIDRNPLREFQGFDILRRIKKYLDKHPRHDNIPTDVGARSSISEAIFNRKMWDMKKIYRNITFENPTQTIDFTIGFIALKFFEDKDRLNETIDASKNYWSDCSDGTKKYPAKKIVSSISDYIGWLLQETQFEEFHDLMGIVKTAISGDGIKGRKINAENVKQIYDIINSMGSLHGAGFDLFGAVYENFASSNEKKTFGEYFTRRHYTYILSKLLLKNQQFFDSEKKFTILDCACGTGGFLTEAFKILRANYEATKTFDSNAKKFLEHECFWGYDVRKENISRTKINMFLVGDGHTNMYPENSLELKSEEKKWNYIITNPPYGSGSIEADTDSISSTRNEVAFLYKVIDLLEVGGNACIILPDGVLENPTMSAMRLNILEKVNITAIISLPKFAFAPYTKEKTYAVYFTKRNPEITKIQKNPIWIYILDNDGFANSDKRFPTKLRNNGKEFLHDEINGYYNPVDGEWVDGILEQRWLTFDDSKNNGTEWIDEKGVNKKLQKGGFLEIETIQKDSFHTMLPEYFLRPYVPDYLTIDSLKNKIIEIEESVKNILPKEIEENTHE